MSRLVWSVVIMKKFMPTEFLDPATLGGVHEEHLAAALCVGEFLGKKGRGVVAAALGRAGAAVGDPSMARFSYVLR